MFRKLASKLNQKHDRKSGQDGRPVPGRKSGPPQQQQQVKPWLDCKAFPHIIDRIIELSPAECLLIWRVVAKKCLVKADAGLFGHLVLTAVRYERGAISYTTSTTRTSQAGNTTIYTSNSSTSGHSKPCTMFRLSRLDGGPLPMRWEALPRPREMAMYWSRRLLYNLVCLDIRTDEDIGEIDPMLYELIGGIACIRRLLESADVRASNPREGDEPPAQRILVDFVDIDKESIYRPPATVRSLAGSNCDVAYVNIRYDPSCVGASQVQYRLDYRGNMPKAGMIMVSFQDITASPRITTKPAAATDTRVGPRSLGILQPVVDCMAALVPGGCIFVIGGVLTMDRNLMGLPAHVSNNELVSQIISSYNEAFTTMWKDKPETGGQGSELWNALVDAAPPRIKLCDEREFDTYRGSIPRHFLELGRMSTAAQVQAVSKVSDWMRDQAYSAHEQKLARLPRRMDVFAA